MADRYGMDVNFSLVVNNDNDYSIGMRLTDSDGIDASSEVNTDDLNEGINAVCSEIVKDFVNQKKQKVSDKKFENQELLDEINRLNQEISRLKVDNQVLEKRISDSINSNYSKENSNKEVKSDYCYMSDDDLSAIFDLFKIF